MNIDSRNIIQDSSVESNVGLEASYSFDVTSAFAKIGEYVPSEAERSQMEYLDRIHEEANAKVFDSRIRF